MRFYTGQHQYYCGIDLHTKNMYVCILDQAGTILVHKNLPTSPDALLRILKPFQPDVAVTVECIFTWYWIADLCQDADIPFILGHALYMKAIHGSKTKNDRIDSHKIAVLLRGGMIPMAHVYPSICVQPEICFAAVCVLCTNDQNCSLIYKIRVTSIICPNLKDEYPGKGIEPALPITSKILV